MVPTVASPVWARAVLGTCERVTTVKDEGLGAVQMPEDAIVNTQVQEGLCVRKGPIITSTKAERWFLVQKTKAGGGEDSAGTRDLTQEVQQGIINRMEGEAVELTLPRRTSTALRHSEAVCGEVSRRRITELSQILKRNACKVQRGQCGRNSTYADTGSTGAGSERRASNLEKKTLAATVSRRGGSR